MFTKRSLIVLLTGLNLLLLAALLIGTYSLPSAYAQARSRPGDFVCVTAKAQGQSYDALYILDVHRSKLHAFYPVNVQTRQHEWAGFRDLKEDFAP